MKKIDLSDIKADELEKTASFTDLMTRSERKQRQREKKAELKESLNEKINKIDKTVNKKKENIDKNKEEKTEEYLSRTKNLDLTKKLEVNLKENVKEERKIKGSSPVTDIGVFVLIALGYFIYTLLFTNYLDNELFLLIDAGVILLMFILFGITILTSKKNNKALAIVNFVILLLFIVFNMLTTFEIIK